MGNEGLFAGNAIVWILVVVFIVISVFLFIRLRRRKSSGEKNRQDPLEETNVGNGRPLMTPDDFTSTSSKITKDRGKPDVVPRLDKRHDTNGVAHGTEDYYNINGIARKGSNAIKIKDLPALVRKQKKNDKPFNEEFEKLVKDKDPNISWTYSEKPELKNLNRFKNIIPYDHTRVKLKEIDGDPLSDYVNASFISGYKRQKAFIACHGPVERTMPGFWRTVWEYKVPTIVMVTNFTEYSTMKMNCEQYWPSNVNASQAYGPVTVTFTSENIYADYVIRKFTLKHASEKGTKDVTHYHYTAWPDHGVPENISSMLKLQKMTKQKPKASEPVLVHCRAGIGRTGTFIALDYLLDEAAATDAVDILLCVQKMRTQRINMVQTQVQYAFLYDCLRLYALLGKTSEAAEYFQTYYNKISGDKTLEKQFTGLEELKVEYTKQELEEGMAKTNADKNRDSKILPSARHRVFFVMMEDGSNPYFNGVSVRGYKHETGYIATQVPLDNTVKLFWKLVQEKQLKSIVCVQNSTEMQWLPDKGKQDFGNITVGVSKHSTRDQWTTCDVTLVTEASPQGTEYANTSGVNDTISRQPPLTVRVFQLKPEWANQPLSSRSRSTFIELHEELIKRQQNDDKPVLVMCNNGATESGLFICTSYAIDMAYIEQEVDVAQVVKQARCTRPQFIPTLEQYKFVHEVMLQYTDTMHTYSNFQR